ncbi:MAG: hypothetical protein LCH73_02080 [Proteobacteria bacterium]|nr:hypothetical protein [Pseudomonadota bacterium]
MDALKVKVEISKIMAETVKINSEARWYPVMVLAAVVGFGAALAKLFL